MTAETVCRFVINKRKTHRVWVNARALAWQLDFLEFRVGEVELLSPQGVTIEEIQSEGSTHETIRAHQALQYNFPSLI